MGNTCETCKAGDFSSIDGGRCRAHPPGNDGWPMIRHDDWCLSWKSKSTVKKKQHQQGGIAFSRQDGYVGITSDHINSWQEKFPCIDVMVEIDKASDWIRSTGKTYKDYEAQLNNWFRTATEIATSRGGYRISGQQNSNARKQEFTQQRKREFAEDEGMLSRVVRS